MVTAIPGLGFQGAILGIAEETAWGTKVTPTSFVELNTDGLDCQEDRLESGAINGNYRDDDEVLQSSIKAAGSFGLEFRYQGMELLLKHALGAVSTAEVASFVVEDSGAGQNNLIDFNIGAGALVATVVAGTYIAGTDQTTALSLCKAIHTAIVAAEATGTYTVTFSSTTKKFTIAETGLTVTALNLLWNTGTNKADGIAALIGYSTAADDTGAQTYTSDTAVVTVYDHTFTISDTLPEGLTLEVDRDITAFTWEGCMINKMDLAIDYAGFLMGNFDVVAEDISDAAATSPTLPTVGLVNFTQGAVTYDGAEELKSFKVSINNSLKADRHKIGARTILKPTRSAKVEVSGSMALEFYDTDKFDDFRAMTSRAIAVTFTGGVIKAALTYAFTINLPVVKLTNGVPKISDAGVINFEANFKAYASSSSAREMNVVVRNTLASVA